MLRACLFTLMSMAWAAAPAAPSDWRPATGLEAQPSDLTQRPQGLWLEAGQEQEGAPFNKAVAVWNGQALGLEFRSGGHNDLWLPRAHWQIARALGGAYGLRLGWGLELGPDNRVDGGWIYRGRLGLRLMAPWDSDLSVSLDEINLRAPTAAPEGLLKISWSRDIRALHLTMEWQAPRQGSPSLFMGVALEPPASSNHYRLGLDLRDPRPRWWLSWGREKSAWLFDLAWSPGLGQNEVLYATLGLPLGGARERPLSKPAFKRPASATSGDKPPLLAVRMERFGSILELSWDPSATDLGAVGFEVWSRVLAGASLIKAHSGLLQENKFATELSLPGAQYGFQVRAVDAKGQLKAASNLIEAGGP